MPSPRAKMILYVTISACVVLAAWLTTVKYSIRRELDRNKDKANLFEEIQIRLGEAWEEKFDLAPPTTTLLQGNTPLNPEQIDELIDKLGIQINTSTPSTTDLRVELQIDTSDWLTYKDGGGRFEFEYPNWLSENKQEGQKRYFYDPENKYTLTLETIDQTINSETLEIYGLYGKIEPEHISTININDNQIYKFMDGDADCGGHDYRIPDQTKQIRIYFSTCNNIIFEGENEIINSFKFNKSE